jgi:hypothetical protein
VALAAGSLALKLGGIEMGEPKPTASLSSMLLARKGAARPAMRRPSITGNSNGFPAGLDDLGWNDMGYDVDPSPNTPMDHDHDSSYTSLANAVPEIKPEVRLQQERIAEQLHFQAQAGFSVLEGCSLEAEIASEPDAFEQPETEPPTAELAAPAHAEPEQQAQAEPILSVVPVVAAIRPASSNTAPTKRALPGQKGKAAFTLRLDNERHLKLRLACAVSNRSAQMLVTEALDSLLDNMPEISQLAARVPAR